MAPYYPLFFDLTGKLCVIVGGGAVAERKVKGLVRAGVRPKVISPTMTKGILRLSKRGLATLVMREYREGDLKGADFAFAATDRKEINVRIGDESARRGVPLNVADNPDKCDFIVPSVVKRGPVSIAVSTSGLAPMLAKRLKAVLAATLTAEYGTYARRVGAFRRFLMDHVEDGKQRKSILKRLGKADVSEVSRMSLKEMKRRFLNAEDR